MKKKVNEKKENDIAKTYKIINLNNENKTPEKSTKEIVKNEEGQLVWFFAIIIMVFLAFLIPYFYLEGKKSFEYAGVKWQIEGNKGLSVYHARFPALDKSNITYNVYLREDPRENNVYAEGNFVDFRKGGYVSISPEVDQCRGEIARVMIDLGSFLRAGVGVGDLQVASNDFNYSVETNRLYVDCPSSKLNTVVSIKMGDYGVIKSKDNPYCYEIYVQDCTDISPVEKFITKTIGDIMIEKEKFGSYQPPKVEEVIE